MWVGIWRFSWMKLLFPRLVWNVPNDSNVYLTFDDGPHPIATPKVLEVLKHFGIKATFFCVGANAQKYPEIIREIERAGHVLANHTYHHDNGWTTPVDVYMDSITRTRAVIKSNLFRPPYGRIKLRSIYRIKKAGYQIIMWSWLSKDYNTRLQNTTIISAAKHIKAGDVLVFHDSQKTEERIEELLMEIIPRIQSKQLTFSTFVTE
jgi:peptidoglycan/xylan/chitin deacetylase (PgdA/CDA1 family)